ncbi:MAG TPA: transcription antitermination factor NusB [Rhizomicrobium sp.]
MNAAAVQAGNGPNRRTARRSARIAAVQALYQMEVTGGGAETVAQEFVDHRFQDEVSAPDEALFRAIVAGVPHRQAEIDRAVASCLGTNWRLQRIDSILRAILRAAGFELFARSDIPARVVIDEYIEIARRFFGDEECGFVNAVLDRLARAQRDAEFPASPPDEKS